MLDVMKCGGEIITLDNIKEKNNCQPNKCQSSQINSKILETDKEKIHFKPNVNNQVIIAILNSKFYLIKQIGKGSTGSVYLSYSILDPNEPKNLYAIKIIEPGEQNEDIINSCEVNFLEKMNHKNILKVYGHGLGILETPSGLKKQVYYIIMDYLNHGSLLSQIEGNKGFGEDFGKLIFAQLLDGLEAIHNSNIVHRDIKLENIMVSGNDFTLKYVDFGFATEKSNGYLTTFLGTPNYAAPELHLKKPYLGVYEDIFSLGVTLFILVTGNLPFFLPLPNDPLYQYIVCVDYINFWRKRNIKVSPSFMELFDNLIAFDPSQRPSISEIRKSKWMQEINWDLLPILKEEFNKREKIRLSSFIVNPNIIHQAFNKNCCNNIYENKLKNADEMLLKIKEKQKIEVIKDIKNQLFSLNNRNKINTYIQNNNKDNDSTLEEDVNDMNKKNELKGFIKIQAQFKHMSSLINLLKQFLKNEGFNISKRDLDNFHIEISNGETDAFLSFEKLFKEIKISFGIINGNMEEFVNLKKIMRKFNVK